MHRILHIVQTANYIYFAKTINSFPMSSNKPEHPQDLRFYHFTQLKINSSYICSIKLYSLEVFLC